MKNFFKKVAFVLALAMVLTNIGPAVSASAAVAPGLKYASKVIYVGGSAFGDYTDNCWTPSKNAEGYKVTYEVTTGKDLIDVASNGKITATGNGIGKAVVTVTYAKAGEQTITQKFTVKVRRNATDVKLVNAVLAQIEEALKIGDEITLKSAKSFVGTSYKTGNYGTDNYMKLVSDQIAYKVSDENVIKVEDGKLIAVGAGNATLSVIAYEYMDASQTPVCKIDYPITVVGGMVSVAQKAVDKVEVVLGSEVEGLKASDFTITRAESKLNIAVKEISVDKNVVTLTTFAEMKDGAEYVVAYDEKELSFKATDGTVADITINKTAVAYQTDTEMSVNLVDASGIIIKTVKFGETYAGLTFTIESAYGYTNGNKLYMFEIGKTATAKAVYRTGKYDTQTGAEIGTVEREFTITAVEKEAIVPGAVQYTITDKTDAIDWSNFTENKSIAVGDTAYVHVYRKANNDADLTQTEDYTLESSNTDVLIVTGTSDSLGKGIYGQLVPLKAGQAYILVKKGNETVITLEITIRPAREYNRFDLDGNTFTLSNTSQISDSRTVKLTFFDQYNEKMGALPYDITQVSIPSGGSDIIIPRTGVSGDITINPSLTTVAGQYQYRVTKGNVSRIINVVVQIPNPAGTTSYRLITDKTSADAVFNKAADDSNKTIRIRVGIYKNGILYDYEDLTTATSTSVKTGNDAATTTLTDTNKALDVMVTDVATVSGSSVVTKAKVGSYAIAVTLADGTKLTGGFVITDSQKALTKQLDTDKFTSGTSYDAIVKELLTFYYDGSKKEDTDFTVKSVKRAYPLPVVDAVPGTDVITDSTISISSAQVLYEIDGSLVEFTINLGGTFNKK